MAVVSELGSVLLLDASPDIRTQSHTLLEWNRYPKGRDSLADAVAVTHGHMGHYAGLLHFGKEAANTEALPLLATPSFLAFVAANKPWDSLVANGNLRPVPLTEPVAIDGSMSVRGISVPHRAEYTDTVALSILIDGEQRFLYLPDIDAWTEWPEAESVINAHAVCLVDATFSTRNELPGRDMDHIRHPLVPDTIERFSHLTSESRLVLGHINHTNSLADDKSEYAVMARRAGFEVAHDGLEMSF